MTSLDPAIPLEKRTPWFMTAAAFEGMLDTQPIDINWWPPTPAAADTGAKE
jgi:hypothetical protein